MRRSLSFLLLLWVLPQFLSAQTLAQRVHEATDYFIGLAERSTSIASDPLLPSVLADSGLHSSESSDHHEHHKKPAARRSSG